MLLAVSSLAAAAANTINNLPASVALATVLGSRGPSAYAALAGLSAGALATPHGSVATLIAFDRAAGHGGQLTSARYTKRWLPTTALAMTAAISSIWPLSGPA